MLRPEALDPALESLPLGSELRSQAPDATWSAKAAACHENSIRFITTHKQQTNKVQDDLHA
jgi:hypothetical protein